MKYLLKEAFDEIEQMMIKNIANSLLQIYFHQHATAEELQKYYGWKEPFKEEEREGLIQDTLTRVEVEQNILKFYKKNKTKIKYEYGNKNPDGDLNLPEKRATGSGAEQTSVDRHAKEDGGEKPGQGADNENGHATDSSQTGDSKN